MDSDLRNNAERFSGFASRYDKFRLGPPLEILDLPSRVAGLRSLGTILDLGCGTGLSTFCWADRACRVVGVDPNAEMLDVARRESSLTKRTNVEFLEGTSSAIRLEDASVDVATCGQSFHWMNPRSTLREVDRLLRPGGVVLIYDCRWPLIGHWKVQRAWHMLFAEIRRIETEHGYDRDYRYWPKNSHRESLDTSGHFRFVTELSIGTRVGRSAEQIVGLALSQGQLQNLLRHGVDEERMGLTAFVQTVQEQLDSASPEWIASFDVRLAVK